jgi:hypothetical protein
VTTFADLEQSVVDALTALEDGGDAIFATVAGFGDTDRKTLAAAIERARKPAAFVVVHERATASDDHRRAGRPRLSVYVATSSGRGQDEARTASAAGGGLHATLWRVTEALQRSVIAADRRLLLVREGGVGGDERGLVWEQVYEVVHEAGTQAPTFDGVGLCGADSDVAVELGELEPAEQRFAFPGIDGEFRRSLGTRGRPLTWTGTLRAADDAAMNALEDGIEAVVVQATPGVVVDAWGRTFADCIAVSFRRRGPRSRDAADGTVAQGFALGFTQLHASVS